MNQNTEWLKTTEIRYCPEISSSHKLLRPVVVFIKRIIRKLFAFIGVPLVSAINEQHHRVFSEITSLRMHVDALGLSTDLLRQQVAVLSSEITELNKKHDELQRLTKLNAHVLSSEITELNKKHDELQRLTKLNAQMVGPLAIEQHKRTYGVIDDSPTPLKMLSSSLARRKDLIAYAEWARQMCFDPTVMHRKNWEWVYITQVLFERKMLKPGKKGLGFAVGCEPLSALFAKHSVAITATDLSDDNPEAEVWNTGNQHASNISTIAHPDVCDNKIFYRNVCFMPLDMNSIPDTVTDFDFCWSSCALEHLGSTERGREFILNTLKTLKPGGISVHTTEFNLSIDESIDTIYGAVYGKRFFESLRDEITAMGHYFAPLDYRLGDHPEDDYIYRSEGSTISLKLMIDNYISTSIGIIIVKSEH